MCHCQVPGSGHRHRFDETRNVEDGDIPKFFDGKRFGIRWSLVMTKAKKKKKKKKRKISFFFIGDQITRGTESQPTDLEINLGAFASTSSKVTPVASALKEHKALIK